MNIEENEQEMINEKVEDLQREITKIEENFQASEKRIEEYKRVGRYDLEAEEWKFKNDLIRKREDLLHKKEEFMHKKEEMETQRKNRIQEAKKEYEKNVTLRKEYRDSGMYEREAQIISIMHELSAEISKLEEPDRIAREKEEKEKQAREIQEREERQAKEAQEREERQAREAQEKEAEEQRKTNEMETQRKNRIQEAKKEYEENAALRKEYRDSGMYEREAQVTSTMNELLAEISKLEEPDRIAREKEEKERQAKEIQEKEEKQAIEVQEREAEKQRKINELKKQINDSDAKLDEYYREVENVKNEKQKMIAQLEEMERQELDDAYNSGKAVKLDQLPEGKRRQIDKANEILKAQESQQEESNAESEYITSQQENLPSKKEEPKFIKFLRKIKLNKVADYIMSKIRPNRVSSEEIKSEDTTLTEKLGNEYIESQNYNMKFKSEEDRDTYAKWQKGELKGPATVTIDGEQWNLYLDGTMSKELGTQQIRIDGTSFHDEKDDKIEER